MGTPHGSMALPRIDMIKLLVDSLQMNSRSWLHTSARDSSRTSRMRLVLHPASRTIRLRVRTSWSARTGLARTRGV
ncbi:hypothetical protein PsYK624_067200 [Phanerochaete sordida]|uniref:Uncharacterized protein n=1 Tax=Phanerochaete sordida TaxID=48140 RepID=A0A9P3G790_9APHY|nr:hypothetical protein PsYK624_067200 [Phanerochaete sordida]